MKDFFKLGLKFYCNFVLLVKEEHVSKKPYLLEKGRLPLSCEEDNALCLNKTRFEEMSHRFNTNQLPHLLFFQGSDRPESSGFLPLSAWLSLIMTLSGLCWPIISTCKGIPYVKLLFGNTENF
jgi:hypothetical protein